MALANGVLVHGPSAWACAIRTEDGELKVVARHKRFRAADVETPLLRGPARLLEAMALLPEIRRALPEARLPFQRPAVLATMLTSAVVVRLVRGSGRVTPAAQELVGGLLSVAPAALALRGSELAGYHGAEHISIGSYEHGETRAKEHERCGSHLIGPLLATSAIGNALASRAPERWRGPARAVAQLGALGASTEIFGWMTRHPNSRVSHAPPDTNVTVLVDFENNSVETALEVARALGPQLWGVRLDTSESLVDRSLWDEMGDFNPTGVNERLVRKVRDALDGDGFEHVKIVASGGFTIEKIRDFEEKGVPVDAYGVGSSLIRGSNDFTADIVLTDGRPSAKVGRRYRPNPRLELVE